jgi:hypothetical protein
MRVDRKESPDLKVIVMTGRETRFAPLRSKAARLASS